MTTKASTYRRRPKTTVNGYSNAFFSGVNSILSELKSLSSGVIAFECYPGVQESSLLEKIILPLNPDLIVAIEEAKKSDEELEKLVATDLTTDRVFGKMTNLAIEDLFNQKQIQNLQKNILQTPGLRIVYGVGATLIPFDYLIYVDLTRWEIQLRYRQGMPNFTANNPTADKLTKYKRGFFLEWRIADNIKKAHYLKSHYIISAESLNHPVMITRKAFEAGMNQLVQTPFRLVPYFDPGVWGGHWMEDHFDLPKNGSNYAWSFDGVPEENSIILDFGQGEFEFPAINLVFFRPQLLLGDRVFQQFGAEFPIRFDMLDTMGGGNLSLQVHPLKAYIKEQFGMNYTQDESYYILDATPESSVYLGLKPGVRPELFFNHLETANQGLQTFQAEHYVNQFKVKKHDHVLIPSGTIHCSGQNTMVLEISATPYIFTFKLWDWGRLDFDGKPRPISLEHGKHNVLFERDTQWVERELMHREVPLSPGVVKTGLHELEFIETHRMTTDSSIESETFGSVNVLNLVEGPAAMIESVDGSFAPFTVYYAETFIIPANIKRYRIKPAQSQTTVQVIKAFIKL